MKKLASLTCLLLFLFLPICTTMGQNSTEPGDHGRHTLIFRGTLIDEAIKKLVELTKIDLIYNPAILKDQRVYSLSRNKRPEEILSDILENSGLDYIQLSSGTFMLIKSAATASETGILSGIVYDKTTGEPLSGANILLADASTGTSSSRSGNFSIAPLLSGKYEVTITYVGYKAVKDTVWIPAQTKSPHQFFLEAKPIFVEPLVVSSIQPRLPYYGTNGEEITNFSGTYSSNTGTPDAIRSVNSIMGMNFSLSLADLYIQGSAAGDHQVRLDGTPVYNPVSLGRLTGAFSPYALKRITVHKAGFGAELGSQLSGIMDIRQDVAALDDNSFLLQADPMNVNARLDLATRFQGGATLKTMMAARTNLWDLYRKPSLENTLEKWDRLDPLLIENLLDNTSVASNFRALRHDSEIQFYDLHLRSQLKFNEFHTSTLSLYQGRNYVQTQLLSHNDNEESDVPDFMYTQDGYDWLNTVSRLQHNWLITPRLDASFGASVSRHRALHHFAMSNSDELVSVPGDFDTVKRNLQSLVARQSHSGDQNMITESSFEAQFNYSLHQNHKLKFGLESNFINYEFSLSDPFYNPTSSKGHQYLISGFGSDEISFGHQTVFTAGSRFTYIPEGDKFFAEPRVSLQHDRPESSIGYFSYKVATGIYRQFINQFDVTNIGPSAIIPSNRFWVPADYTTEIPKSYHLSSGVLVEPTEHFAIRWEGYYKWNPQILSLDYHALLQNPNLGPDHFEDQRNFIVSGKSYSFGTGINLSQFIDSWKMEASVAYQYSEGKQRIPNRFENQYIPAPWNKPHKLTASMNWNLFAGLTTTLRWQSVWGRSWAFKRAYYDYLAIDETSSVFGPYRIGTPSDDTLSPFHQLDFGISYQYSIGTSKFNIRVDLVNLLNRKNILEKQIMPVPSVIRSENYQIQERTLPGLIPSVSFEWFL